MSSSDVWYDVKLWRRRSAGLSHQSTPIRKASPLFGLYSLSLATQSWPGWVDLGGCLDRDKFTAPGVEPRYNNPSQYNWVRRRVSNFVDLTNVATNYVKTANKVILTPNSWSKHYRYQAYLRVEAFRCDNSVVIDLFRLTHEFSCSATSATLLLWRHLYQDL